MKQVVLTMEEWQRLAAVTPQERERALKKLKRWVHHEILHRGFNLELGPFSRTAVGGDAVEVISDEFLVHIPEHVRSHGRKLTDSRPEWRCRRHFSGACLFTFPCLPFIFVIQSLENKERQIWQRYPQKTDFPEGPVAFSGGSGERHSDAGVQGWGV